MIRITITAAAFEAIAATMPLGSVGCEPEPDAKGERWIWLEPRLVDRLRALRGPGESYSDVILRLAKSHEKLHRGFHPDGRNRKRSHSLRSRNPCVLGVNRTWRRSSDSNPLSHATP
jgi:hypothetical protein